MKKISLISLALAATMTLTACGAENKVISGVEYGTYGLVNDDEVSNPNIHYEVSGWSVFWSIVLAETVVAPIYFIGWDLYQPIAQKDPSWVRGQVK